MTLPAIGILCLAALASNLLRDLLRGQRKIALLLLSVVALYALQPSGLEVALPTATLLLIVGVWWLVTPASTADDHKLLALLGGIACLAALPGSLRTLPPMVALGVGVVGLGAAIPKDDEQTRRRLALAFVGLIVALFVILKLPALHDALAGALPTSIPLDWQWLGFSYIAFRLMHVLLDFRNGRLQPLALWVFALYVIFFPGIPAGPIDRVEHFTRELARDPADGEMVASGLFRLGVGLFKKFVLADTLAYVALSPQLAAQTRPGMPLPLWIMLYAYAFRLFFDFAGYTDIAIGMGLLAGIRLPENFNAPYLKRNITAFWNSWHITLATWFRNYFFTPLSRALMGTRLRSRRLLIILIAQVSTMILIGLWHGIALNFVLWGAWHGVGLWLHRWQVDHSRRWDAYVAQRPRLARAIHVGSVLVTFHFVAIGWVFFALPDPALIGKTLAGLVGIHG